ncbi:MAG: hypothetical protein V4615_05245 [Bacteroidota bacterium]
MKDVVARVSATMQSRSADSFPVYFDYGLYVDVANNLYKGALANESTYPLIWLVANRSSFKKGDTPYVFGRAKMDIIVAMPTNPAYTWEQRLAEVFKKRLVPVYSELMYQIGQTPAFCSPDPEAVLHDWEKKIYWGGAEAGQPNTKNYFSNFIDALQIQNMELEVETHLPERFKLNN